jgi:hypothetical protein
MKPHNVSSPRKRKDGKTYWFKVGVAWARDDGGFKVDLDALPLPDAEGKVTLLISPPRDEQDQAEYRPTADVEARLSKVFDDEIPF